MSEENENNSENEQKEEVIVKKEELLIDSEIKRELLIYLNKSLKNYENQLNPEIHFSVKNVYESKIIKHKNAISIIEKLEASK